MPIRSSKDIFKTILDHYTLLFVFVAMVVVFTILVPSFFTISNFINILVTAASTGIATVGMAIVILQKGIDLSAGSVMYFGVILCSQLIGHGHSLIVFILVALLAGAVIGLINGTLITIFKVMPFIATYGTMILVRGVALTISGQKTIIFADPVSVQIISQRFLGIPVIVYLLFLVLIITSLILSKTQFGRQLYAIGNNEHAAEKLGINVKRNRLIAYVLCSAFASCAGLIAGAQSGTFNPTLGSGKEFVFISAAVIGGVSLSGGKARVFPSLFLGILIITAIESGLVMVSANPYLYQIIRGGLIVVAVIIDSIKYKGNLR